MVLKFYVCKIMTSYIKQEGKKSAIDMGWIRNDEFFSPRVFFSQLLEWKGFLPEKV